LFVLIRKSLIHAFLLFAAFLAPRAAMAQCKEQFCRNVETVYQAAKLDFREYRSNQSALLNLSDTQTTLKCQMDLWANNVPFYVCFGDVPAASGEAWYRSIVYQTTRIQPSWQVKYDSRGSYQAADAGPPDCEVTPTQGPRIGQCPFHVQMNKMGDTTKLYLWINSFSSPYLLHPAVEPKGSKVSASSPAAAACDAFCQSFKKIFAARLDSFAEFGVLKQAEAVSPNASVSFEGAQKCAINQATRPSPDDSHSNDTGTAFVCYWQEDSATSANNRFRGLVLRAQSLLPADWSAHEQKETAEVTGAAVTIWVSVEPGAKHDVRVYLSGSSVALHFSSWTPSSPAPSN
jgi:hypothetical protein